MTDLIPGKSEEIKEDRYYRYLDDDGRLHVVDIVTGDVVKSAPDFEKGLVPGETMAPQYIKGNSKFWRYEPTYADLVSQFIMEGETLTAICARPGFPSISIMARWREQHPDLEQAIQAARRCRAGVFEDMVIEELDDLKDVPKEKVPARKLYLDTLQKLAEKNDPRTYGSKKEEDNGKPSIININTGVPLADTPVTIEVEKEKE